MSWFGDTKRGRIAEFFGNDPTLVFYPQFSIDSRDNSGNGAVPTDTAMVYGVNPPRFNLGALFNGSTSRVQYPSGTASLTGNFSIALWFYRTTDVTATNESLVSKYDNGANVGGYDLRMYFSSPNYYIGLTTVDSLGNAGGGDIIYHFNNNQWYFLVATYDGANSNIYINGLFVGQVANTINPAANAKLLNIGDFGYYTPSAGELGRYFNGRMDDLAIFSRALPINQISQYYEWATRIKKNWINRWFIKTPITTFIKVASASVSNSVSRLATVARIQTMIRNALSFGLVDSINQKTDTNSISNIYGGSGTDEEKAQSFIAHGKSIVSVTLKPNKTGLPSDNIVVSIVSSRDGTPLGSVSVAASAMVTGTPYTFTFSSPIAVTPGSTYYVQITRSGARDTSNFIAFYISYQKNPYLEGSLWNKNSGVWTNDTISDFYFSIAFDTSTYFTAVRSRITPRAISASVSNAVSRLATSVRLLTLKRNPLASTSNAASRLAISSRFVRYAKSVSSTVSNAASRFAIANRVKISVRSISSSVSNAVSRFATVARSFVYNRVASVSVSNSVSRLATALRKLTSIRVSLASVSNAASRLATVKKFQNLKRSSIANVSNAASRFATILVRLNGHLVLWNKRVKGVASWVKRTLGTSIWTKRGGGSATWTKRTKS